MDLVRCGPYGLQSPGSGGEPAKAVCYPRSYGREDEKRAHQKAVKRDVLRASGFHQLCCVESRCRTACAVYRPTARAERCRIVRIVLGQN